MKALLAFLVACASPQMQRPVDVLGTGTICRPVNGGREVCIDSQDYVWDCRFVQSQGWKCKLVGAPL